MGKHEKPKTPRGVRMGGPYNQQQAKSAPKSRVRNNPGGSKHAKPNKRGKTR